MEPFESYKLYQALKLHFESDSYDAVKYNFKTSAKPQAFWKRKDKYFFAKVGRRFNDPADLIDYYSAHFVADNKWIGEMLQDDEIYQAWLKKNQSLSYVFEQDLNKLHEVCNQFDELFTIDVHPLIVNKYLQEEISLETVVIINKLTGFMKKADKEITETIIWPEVSLKIRKYDPFVKVDLDKMKKIVLRVFTS